MGTAGADILLQQTVERAVRRRAGVLAGHLTVDGEVSIGSAGHLSLPNGPKPPDGPRIGAAPGIGLAWQRPRSPGEPVLWHNGGTGGFRSVVGVRPRSGDALVMLANHARGVDLAGLRLLHRLSSE